MRARKRVLAVTLAGVTAVALATPAQAAPHGPKFADDPTTLVDTSIGNNGDGTTFPGATTPFGMVQLSPDTQLKKYASYDYAQDTTLGFSHTHLSGVGCQTMGNFRFMPTTGAVTSSDPAQYGAKFSHANETRQPGYYGVKLDNGIDAELSATQRTGQHRYTYPAGATSENVLIEVGESNGYTYAGDVHVVGDDTVEGWLQGGNFCWETQKERYKVFFSAKFDRKFTGFGTWTDNKLTPNQRDASLGNQRAGAWLSFGADKNQVGASVGVSYTSVDGARLNRKTEQPKSFDKARKTAHDTWADELNRMRVAGGTLADQRTYYSALYRSLLHPSVGSDVDGSYRGFDDAVHRGRDTYYQMFSLWDTYRSQNQLVALLHPDKAADMTKSVLKIYQDGGWVPRWALAGGETNVMSGDPVTPWVVDNYRRGLLDDRTARRCSTRCGATPPKSRRTSRSSAAATATRTTSRTAGSATRTSPVTPSATPARPAPRRSSTPSPTAHCPQWRPGWATATRPRRCPRAAATSRSSGTPASSPTASPASRAPARRTAPASATPTRPSRPGSTRARRGSTSGSPSRTPRSCSA